MWQRSLVRAILRHRIAVLAATAVVSVVAALYASRVGLESSIEIWFLEDDPTLVSYREFLDRFGADEFAVVGVFARDVFAPEVVKAVERVSEAARDVPWAYRVTSLTTVKVFDAVDGGVEVVPLVPEVPETESQGEALRRRARSTSWVMGNLVSTDGTATGVFVELDPDGNTFTGKTEMVEALREIARRVERPGIETRISGSPVFDEAFFRYQNRDMALFAPVAFVLVVAIVTFVFRRVTAVVIPISVVLLASLWTHGVMGALGIDVNIITTMLVALILAIGVADTIHVLAEYDRQLTLGRTRRDAVEESLTNLIEPCFFTSATTAVGLLSLVASDLQPIAEFGWLAALGVGFAFLLSITFVPTLLTVTRPPDPAFVERQRTGPMSRLLDRLGRPDRARSHAVLLASGLLVVFSAFAIARIDVGANPVGYFKKNDPVRRDMAVIDERLGGGTSVELLVHAPGQGLLEPTKLRRLGALQDWIENLGPFGRTLSILDALEEMNRAMHGGDPAEAVLPGSRNLTAQYYLLMEGEEDFDAFLQDAYSTGRITARAELSRAGEATALMPAVEEKLAREFAGEELRVEATGFIKLMVEMEEYILDSQIRSFGVAFLLITMMMMGLLRSWRLGLFSMIPNVAPIAFGLAFMGIAGIPLDPGTAMIASIALGLVVDDSVHFLHRLRTHLAAGASLEAAIHSTVTGTGRPIITTSVVLAAGYSVLGLGSFNPNVHFGVVTAVVIVLALLCDLVMLPAALLVIRPRFGGTPKARIDDVPRRSAAGV